MTCVVRLSEGGARGDRQDQRGLRQVMVPPFWIIGTGTYARQRGLRQVMDRSFRLCDDRGRRAHRGLRQVMASPLLETTGSDPDQQGGRGRVVSFDFHGWAGADRITPDDAELL